MASRVAAAARQAAIMTRLSSAKPSPQSANLIQRRGLAGAADHHGPPRVNVWEDPMSPSKWKEEHVSLIVLENSNLLLVNYIHVLLLILPEFP
ncbi:hypothetical protein CK203_014089 [Vitis vinifera]|uniref:Uncharacterized protein n=1 Tax=Vitis vinifera TaxID=29760 RepID=A0A438JI30_VITVI|nr:hypothetical protein CK203_014089 [Vitis vinifera]